MTINSLISGPSIKDAKHFLIYLLYLTEKKLKMFHNKTNHLLQPNIQNKVGKDYKGLDFSLQVGESLHQDSIRHLNYL